MTKATLVLLATLLASTAGAQNLFPRKFDNCNMETFCLDCGDKKASVDDQKLNEMLGRLENTLNLKGIKGKLLVQILVDSLGHGCVLSHSDPSNYSISKGITKALNAFDGYIPAQTKGKPEPLTSFNMSFEINEGAIVAKIERLDLEAFKKSFNRPVSPEIYNKKYKYKNEHLNTYTITVWNEKNSDLPNNMDDNLTIDKNGLIWLTVGDDGLVSFDGSKFSEAGPNLADKGKRKYFYTLATDNNNTKWTYSVDTIFSYDGKEWKAYTSKEVGIGGAHPIINNPATSEVFFCSDAGLVIYKNGAWDKINKQKFDALPSNGIFYAKRDSRNRIWIGTDSGSVLMEENGKITNFEEGTTLLKGKCITSMDEDEEGNLYFSVYAFNRKDKKKVNTDEGIVIWYKDGTVKQFTTDNSGMPINHTTCVLYDKVEKVLWISTNRAGLVRYDLKDGWENYHPENSALPTSYISMMAFDRNGVLWLATRQGLVRIERK